ncbi:MAG: hypothetical protein RJB08_1357 [Actinomycetota bacterium]|jgi:hypothetical protein
MIRLRQIALVAHDLDAATAEARRNLAVDVCFRDPGVGEFGLRNALFRIGDQFLEIVSPQTDGTTAGRLLEKLGGDCGYMALFEVDDLDERMAHLTALGVRAVWSGDFRQIRGRHLHPKDTGGTLVSFDQPDIPGAWHWGGPDWRSHAPSTVAASIASVTISSALPDRCRSRWTEIGIDNGVEFVDLNTPIDVLAGVSLAPINNVDVGKTFRLCGVDFTFVPPISTFSPTA